MKSISVLDVTLRDGGCVIDFNFGQEYMEQILSAQEQSGVEYIELGYLDQKKGSEKERTQYCNEQVIRQTILKHKKPGVTYLAMFDFGKFDPDLLQENDGKGIDGIRLAFHKKDRNRILPTAKKVLEKGYKLFVQPMIVMRYSDNELIELIDMVNKELPDASAFYIVDSFGEMRENDLNRIAHLVDHNLKADMPLGFHSHNNLQLSYSNAINFLKFYSDRDLIVDSAILGMGKGAGNLNTELFLEHLNLYYHKHYAVAPLLDVIDRVINTIRSESYWGYSVEYYLSSVNHCTPSYAGHFYKKHMLPIPQVSELLGLIEEGKKISFDKEYAEQLYLAYNARRHQNDDPAIQVLTEKIKGKTALLIAPGKRLREGEEQIDKLLNDPEVVSLSLNAFDCYDTDYVLTTRLDAFEEAREKGKRIVATSSVSGTAGDEVLVIDYGKWITVENGVQDSSGIVALKLMTACGAAKILLAGFDGFSADINQNYYNRTMRRPVSAEEAEKRNAFFRSYVKRLRKIVPVEFITKSRYEENDNED